VEQFFDSNGVSIRYVERGHGAPVVLVHSYCGSFEGQFGRTGVADGLAQHYRVIGLDLRGHGGSAKPHDAAQYGAEMALDLVRLLDHLDLTRAHFLGYSLGAHIVAQLLTLHPERFTSATLGGACGRRHWTPADDARVETEAQEMEHGLLRTQLSRLGPPQRPALDPVQVRALSEKVLAGNDLLALAAIRRSNRAQVVTDAQMAAVRVPVLGIVGSQDPYVARFRELQRLIADMELVIIDGARHDDAVAQPGFLDAALAFLAAHSA
jgi:pimeloyl-ACP methyl ester carboxylesterase